MTIFCGIFHQARQARLGQEVRQAPLVQVEPRVIQDPLDLKDHRDPIRAGGAHAGFLIEPPWIPQGEAIRDVVGRNERAISTSKGHPLHPLLLRLRKLSA